MARPAKYHPDQILDAARGLVCTRGPSALSIVGVAERLGAPSGSIYHRFRSRDTLAGTLWLRAVERFQSGLVDALDTPDARSAALHGAAHVVSWSRNNVDDAKLLLLYRSSDFVDGVWPAHLVARNQAQRERATGALDDLCRRLGAITTADRQRVVFAVVDVPYAAVRGPLSRNEAPSSDLDVIVDDAIRGVLDGITIREVS